MAANRKIDVDAFVKAYAESGNATQSYISAHPDPDSVKHPKQSATQYMRQDFVQKALRDFRNEGLADLQTMTLHKIRQLVEHDFDNLSERDKFRYGMDLMDRLGITVPKTVNIHKTEEKVISASNLSEKLLAFAEENPAIAAALARPVEGTVEEESSPSEGAGPITGDSGDEQA